MAIINTLGHPSLSSLEDYIYLHGACQLVPLTASQITSNDTQSQAFSLARPGGPDTAGRAEQSAQLARLQERDSKRRDELRRVRAELARAQGQVGFLEGEVRRERAVREECERDWRRVSEEHARLVEERDATAGGPSASQGRALEEEIARLDGALASLQAEIASLQQMVQLQGEELEGKEELEEELVRVRARGEMEREKREEGERREERERAERARLEREVGRLRRTLGEEGGAGARGVSPMR